jgi:23S rRNA pseudouridine2605 synthase
MAQRTRTSGTTTATTPDGVPAGEVRLQKFLAQAGLASRREAERLIQAGRVEVNGRIVTRLGTRIDPRRDAVRVDGSRIRDAGRRVYFLLNKPRGYVTTTSDPEGRPTVMQLLEGVGERIFPVGRLDWDSEGLLILTNDGELANRLTHPRNHVPKIYRVKVKGRIPSAAIEAARHGVLIDGRRSLPARVRRVSGQTHTWLEIVLREGRKNQIRRIFERLGHPVLKLRRVAIGPLADRILKPGQFRRLTPEEVHLLRGTP